MFSHFEKNCSPKSDYRYSRLVSDEVDEKECEIVVPSVGYLEPKGGCVLKAVAAFDRPSVVPVIFDWDVECPSTVATE